MKQSFKCTISSAAAGIQSLVAGFPLHEAWQQVSESGGSLKGVPLVFSALMKTVPVWNEYAMNHNIKSYSNESEHEI